MRRLTASTAFVHSGLGSLLAACLLFPALAGAQGTDVMEVTQAPPLPEWVVLVLQPLPGKRARPVTGVVVSSDGLIIVPSEFADPGDQLIVLDGGTDIIEHGRAVIVRQQDAESGLLLLSAPNLKRSPPPLAAGGLDEGETLYLRAFPPAEQIAEGARPLWEETRVASAADGSGADYALDAGSLPPNVTGPLVDACGALVAFNASTGVQSMDATPPPRTLWTAELAEALERFSVRLGQRSCGINPDTGGPTLEAGEPSWTAGNQNEQSEKAVENNMGASEQGSSSASSSSNEQIHLNASRLYQWVIGILVALLLGAAWLLWRQRKPPAKKPESLLTDDTPESEGRKRTGSESSAPADITLLIQGRLADGTPFESRCEVSSAGIDVVIGRGDVDVVIDSPDIQREHARLGGSIDLLTLTDLGSVRGSWINRVPCMKGEIMYISPDDLITLGDVSFRVAPVEVPES